MTAQSLTGTVQRACVAQGVDENYQSVAELPELFTMEERAGGD